MAPAQPPRPPDDVEDEEDSQDLAALGFLFDAAAAKTWVKHSFPTSSPPSQPGSTDNDDTPAPKLIEIEVQVIDDEDEPGALQTGQRTWPAAPFMADYLVQNWARTSAAVCVLELGAGCGLLGLTLAQLPGVKDVIMTDHDPGTLVLIREGIARNQVSLREGARCEAVLVEWGGEVDACLLPKPGLGQEEGTEEARVLLIVGSDLIYSVDVVASLFQTVAGVLKRRREGREGSSAAAVTGAAAAAAAAVATAATAAADRFLLCGSFALGEVIDRKVEEVVRKLKLQREIVLLGEAIENKEMWMHVYTLPTHS